MIRKSLVLAAVVACAGIAFAAPRTEGEKLTGYIVDNACEAINADDAAAIQHHPVSCALMPDRADSGYSLYTDGRLLQFDADSNEMVEALLKKAPKDQKGFMVQVEGAVSDDTLHASKITPAGPQPVDGGDRKLESTGLNPAAPR